MATDHILLMGPMGSGKTTIGRRLAETLNRPFIDSDDLIETTHGATGRELAERMGVRWLHETEALEMRKALESDEPAVVAAAASVADRPELLAALQSDDVFVVLLEADPDVLVHRAQMGRHRRLVDWSDMNRRTEQRRARLADVADVVVSTTAADPDYLVAEVLAAFNPVNDQI